MDYKTILVHLDASPRCTERVRLATQLARDFGAHLTGLYAATFRNLPEYARAEGAPDISADWQRLHRERALQAVGRFREEAASVGVDGAEARIVERDPVATVALHARYADLVVVGQADPDENHELLGVPANLAESIVQSVPRPVLVVPYVGCFPTLGTRILVGWDTSRAATRTIADALPLLKRAANVTVLVVSPESTMGGFGHFRLRELLFGGVTRSVLGQSPLPVLIEN